MLFFLWRKISILHVYLPIEIEILLSMERAMYLIACGTEILRVINICMLRKLFFCLGKERCTLVEGAVLNFLWKERCNLACGDSCT